MASRRLGSAAAISAVGAIVFNVGQLLVVMVLARTSGAASVGAYALALAVSAPMFAFSNLSLRSVLISDRDDLTPFGVYRGVRIVATLLGLALSVVFVLQSSDLGVLAVLVCVAKAIDAIAELYIGLLQKKMRFVVPALSLAVNGLLTPILVIVCMSIWSIGWSMVGSVISSAIALLIVMLSARDLEIPADRDRAGAKGWASLAPRLVRTALPLGLASALIVLTANMPRYVLEGARGSEDLGVFSAVSFLTIAGLTLFSGIAQVILPNFVGLYSRAGGGALNRAVARGLAISAVIGLLAAVVVIIAGDWLLTLLYGPAYAESGMLLVLTVGMAVALASWVLDLGLTTIRQFRAQMYASVVAVLGGFGIAMTLVPPYGALGAGWAVTLTYLVHGLARGAAYVLATRKMGVAGRDRLVVGEGR